MYDFKFMCSHLIFSFTCNVKESLSRALPTLPIYCCGGPVHFSCVYSAIRSYWPKLTSGALWCRYMQFCLVFGSWLVSINFHCVALKFNYRKRRSKHINMGNRLSWNFDSSLVLGWVTTLCLIAANLLARGVLLPFFSIFLLISKLAGCHIFVFCYPLLVAFLLLTTAYVGLWQVFLFSIVSPSTLRWKFLQSCPWALDSWFKISFRVSCYSSIQHYQEIIENKRFYLKFLYLENKLFPHTFLESFSRLLNEMQMDIVSLSCLSFWAWL